MGKRICFYHKDDFDGHCSGAIVKYRFPDCKMHPITYGEKFPFEMIGKEDIVIMVDFALQPFEEMVKLKESCQLLIWIDHHISAIKERERLQCEITGARETKLAACELTWSFFFSDRDMPDVVFLLGRYDVWDVKRKNVLPFQYGFKVFATDPTVSMKIWNELFSDEDCPLIQEVIRSGKICMEYTDRQNEKIMCLDSFDIEFAGLKCLAVNKLGANSQVFQSKWDKNKYDAMLAFGWRNNQWHVSLYTDKEGIDVSKICKSFGGGGHVQAAGFQAKTLDFIKNG